jgi:hypothetical protein
MKRYLIVGVLAVLFVISLSAAENAKIKLPDGLYMYDSWIAHLTNGDVSVRFEKFFVVQKNSIYSSQEAIRKFGTAHLMIANKTYKILFGGEQIGEIHIVNIDDDEHVNYKEELLTKNIKRGPAYCEESIYIGRLGSVARHLAVPEKYKVLRPISFKEISKEEVDKISRLAKDKLFHLVKNRKELKRCRIIETKLVREKMELLDKISVGNNEMYIGIYKFAFGSADKALGLCEFDVLFYVKEGNIYAITSDHDDETLFGGEMKIQGILDVDGCGEGEVIIEKLFTGEAGPTINLEIYKQKADGNWTQITRIKARRAL